VPSDPNLAGIMPQSFGHIISAVSEAGKNVEFLVRCSFLEIYKEDVVDLLNHERCLPPSSLAVLTLVDLSNRKSLAVKEDKDRGVFVKDLST
jgi:hypothetical protein